MQIGCSHFPSSLSLFSHCEKIVRKLWVEMNTLIIFLKGQGPGIIRDRPCPLNVKKQIFMEKRTRQANVPAMPFHLRQREITIRGPLDCQNSQAGLCLGRIGQYYGKKIKDKRLWIASLYLPQWESNLIERGASSTGLLLLLCCWISKILTNLLYNEMKRSINGDFWITGIRHEGKLNPGLLHERRRFYHWAKVFDFQWFFYTNQRLFKQVSIGWAVDSAQFLSDL